MVLREKKHMLKCSVTKSFATVGVYWSEELWRPSSSASVAPSRKKNSLHFVYFKSSSSKSQTIHCLFVVEKEVKLGREKKNYTWCWTLGDAILDRMPLLLTSGTTSSLAQPCCQQSVEQYMPKQPLAQNETLIFSCGDCGEHLAHLATDGQLALALSGARRQCFN